jgi:hypothetical protein
LRALVVRVEFVRVAVKLVRAALDLHVDCGTVYPALFGVEGVGGKEHSAAGNPTRAMTSNVNGQSSQGDGTRIDGILDDYRWLPNNVAYVVLLR